MKVAFNLLPRQIAEGINLHLGQFLIKNSLKYYDANGDKAGINIKIYATPEEVSRFVSLSKIESFTVLFPECIIDILTPLIQHLESEGVTEVSFFELPETITYEDDDDVWTVENNWKTFDFVVWWEMREATIHKLQEGMKPHQVLTVAK
jgi:hypothetical protein